ncbi:MAG: hypothetical protein K6B69_04705 [Lachnospiraceae bacterium]|nr:hypothetical protein [Lachnospiraceae bacterium]
MNKKAAEATFLSILFQYLPFGVIILLQMLAPVIARSHEKVVAQQEAVAILESAEEATFLSTFLPHLLLALSAAFTLNFILILFYSREKKNPEAESMSGTCAHFEIKKPEIS